MQKTQHADPAELISLSQAAKIIPGRPHTSTVFRWHTKGLRGVRLECRRYGSKIFTSPQWLDNFARDLAEAAQQTHPPTLTSAKPLKRNAGQRQAAIAKAQHELKKAGI